MSKSYRSEVTSEQWELLLTLIPLENPACRPRCVDLRAVIHAIFYILCTGCAWRMMPHDFPNWQSFAIQATIFVRSGAARF